MMIDLNDDKFSTPPVDNLSLSVDKVSNLCITIAGRMVSASKILVI